jgi:hypothetical protein
MISIEIKDIHGKILSLNDKIRMIDEETEEPYGEISPVELSLTDSGSYEVVAFKKNFSYKVIHGGQFAPLFEIQENKGNI